MRCKVGDLAIIVRSVAGNEGKIVRCLELVEDFQWLNADGSESTEAAWRIDREIPTWKGRLTVFAKDRYLRPIRPDADPESITTDEVLEVVA